MWDLGTAAGSHSVSYDMIFSDVWLPAPAQMVAPIAGAGTRAQVATFLSRALGLAATTVDAFRYDDAHLLEDYLNLTAAAGVFLGCSEDHEVCPDEMITRGELSAVLVRAFDLASATPAAFSDAKQHWAEPFIETIGGLGISIGCTADGGIFCPEHFGTRGEIALFLYRTMALE